MRKGENMLGIARVNKRQSRSSLRHGACARAVEPLVESLEVRRLFSGLLNLPFLPSPPGPSLGVHGGSASAVGPVAGPMEVTINSANNLTANLGGSPTLILPPFVVQIDVQVD